jgi:DNA-binding beta-propeller fold protein YncE
MRRFDRPRLIALVAGIVLALAGAVLAILAPGPPVLVPAAPGASPDAPMLRYLFALPESDDAPLSRPVGVAVGGGRVYVTDSEAGVLRSFSTAGPDAGDIGTDVLRVPAYVTKNPFDGSLLVTDRELGMLLRFDTDGTLLAEVRPADEPTGTWQPLGIAADGEGAIAVTDASARHRVLVLDKDGAVITRIGGTPSPGATGNVSVALDFPNAVGFANEEIWVSDSSNHRVLVFDRTGAFERAVRMTGVARGLAFLTDEAGAFEFAVVADALGSEIVVLDPQGAEVARFGGPGTAPGLLAYPNDLAYDAGTRRLYVADTGNARVQVWEMVPADEAEETRERANSRALAPMLIAGLVLMALGAVLFVVALWPRAQE